jgi:hypothetical protein
MATRPRQEFGKRGAVLPQTAAPVKRSGHVALLLMGTVAIGAGAYAMMPGANCQPASPGAAAPSQTGTECSSRGYSSSSSHRASWSHSNFYGGSSSSSTASDSGSSGVTRGGFGSFARSVASHFSRGG